MDDCRTNKNSQIFNLNLRSYVCIVTELNWRLAQIEGFAKKAKVDVKRFTWGESSGPSSDHDGHLSSSPTGFFS